jgi:hypothetical protein
MFSRRVIHRKYAINITYISYCQTAKMKTGDDLTISQKSSIFMELTNPSFRLDEVCYGLTKNMPKTFFSSLCLVIIWGFFPFLSSSEKSHNDIWDAGKNYRSSNTHEK